MCFALCLLLLLFFVFQPNYAFNQSDLSGFSKINFPALCACFCVFCFVIWFFNEVRSDCDSSITLLGLRCMFFSRFYEAPLCRPVKKPSRMIDSWPRFFYGFFSP